MCNPNALRPKKKDFTFVGALNPVGHIKRMNALPGDLLHKPPLPVDTSEKDAIDAENDAAAAANLQLAATRRRRRLSSMFTGSHTVLGAPAGRGAPAGGGGGGGGRGSGGGTPVTSTLAGGSRSYGGRTGLQR